MFLKNKNYEEELDRLSLEVERAHLRLATLKESQIYLQKIVRKLVHNQKTENCRKEFCYTITENDIVSSYEDPKYLIKHINKCLDRQEPFTLNEMAKNYWQNSLKEKTVNLKYTLGAKEEEKNTNSTYQWR